MPPTVHPYSDRRGAGGGAGPGQTASTISRSLDSGPVLDLRRVRGELLEKEKTTTYVQSKKRFCISLPVQKRWCYKKKKKKHKKKRRGLWAGGGCNFSLVHTCKYQENEVRLKCILNILNFWSWVIKNQQNQIKNIYIHWWKSYDCLNGFVNFVQYETMTRNSLWLFSKCRN